MMDIAILKSTLKYKPLHINQVYMKSFVFYDFLFLYKSKLYIFQGCNINTDTSLIQDSLSMFRHFDIACFKAKTNQVRFWSDGLLCNIKNQY